jgi:hypothetical protein
VTPLNGSRFDVIAPLVSTATNLVTFFLRNPFHNFGFESYLLVMHELMGQICYANMINFPHRKKAFLVIASGELW